MRSNIEIKSPEQLRIMERSGALLAEVLAGVRERIVPGVTPRELDAWAEDAIRAGGATPNFKGYDGFPATLCISVNDTIVHGIPDSTPIADGDVVSIDGGCIVEGWHSDSAFSVIAGAPKSDDDVLLLEVTEQAMWAGIAASATARRTGEIGAAIEAEAARLAGDRLHPLEDFGGHGIGTAMHQEPMIMNYRTRGRGERLRPGMAFCIEPMFVLGDAEWALLDDEWTVKAVSGANAAHFEHTVAYTAQGIRVLTAADGGEAALAERGVAVAAL